MELRAPGFKLTGQKPFCGSAMGFMQVAEYTPSVNYTRHDDRPC